MSSAQVVERASRGKTRRRAVGRLYKLTRRGLSWHLHSSRRWSEIAHRHRWVFVAGCNRSGKTTLSNLFGNHPRVTVIPNGNLHTTALPNAVTEHCPHVWTEKLDRFRLTERDDRSPAARLAFDWLHFSEHPKEIILIESDLPCVQMLWLQEIFAHSYFLGVVRNGYAVSEGLRLKEGYSLDRCARQWNKANQVMLEDAPRVRNFKLVVYEKFVERPMQVMEDIARFLGIESDPLKPLVQNGWVFGNTDTAPSTLRNANPELIGRLSPEEVEIVSSNAGEMLRFYSYQPFEVSYAGPGRA